ncbi:hypothetical protein BS50DRAFT_107655 [Corynespora cassiicola Philippines]|uniref:Uncharacterized protein n=1 Tax=Corynespora cassiicola Philippines TaxID=1448308 RepID=A0A2T2NCR0_CORCC|nr:hypothetical protein BS50DRAFT_107655 [Corynespora cassiicola Philippines]
MHTFAHARNEGKKKTWPVTHTFALGPPPKNITPRLASSPLDGKNAYEHLVFTKPRPQLPPKAQKQVSAPRAPVTQPAAAPQPSRGGVSPPGPVGATKNSLARSLYCTRARGMGPGTKGTKKTKKNQGLPEDSPSASKRQHQLPKLATFRLEPSRVPSLHASKTKKTTRAKAGRGKSASTTGKHPRAREIGQAGGSEGASEWGEGRIPPSTVNGAHSLAHWDTRAFGLGAKRPSAGFLAAG